MTGKLTQNQLLILQALSEGETQKEIAYRTDRLSFTIKQTAACILVKLGARNISHAVAIALRGKLIQ